MTHRLSLEFHRSHHSSGMFVMGTSTPGFGGESILTCARVGFLSNRADDSTEKHEALRTEVAVVTFQDIPFAGGTE